MGVTAIVPIKPWALSKSRLHTAGDERAALARGFSLDVLDAVSAASSVGQLVIVTAEPQLGIVAARLGAALLPDRPLLAPDMLNAAIDKGRRWAMTRRPVEPVLVVPADLPALTASALDAAVERLSCHDTAFVPDLAATGTTLSWARDPRRLRTRYGVGSAASHAHDGAQEVRDVDVRVRQDVDTRVDLREARRLGVGAHTLAALAEVDGVRERVRMSPTG